MTSTPRRGGCARADLRSARRPAEVLLVGWWSETPTATCSRSSKIPAVQAPEPSPGPVSGMTLTVGAGIRRFRCLWKTRLVSENHFGDVAARYDDEYADWGAGGRRADG